MKPKLGKKNPNYKQGIFTPNNPKKYKGNFPIVYRSGLELKVFRWMDNNTNVTSWGSESIVIPYQSPLDGRVHRYFPDLIAHLNSKDGSVKKLVIEIKPEKQTLPPVSSIRKKKSTMLYEQVQYAVNQEKWKAAKTWANKKGYQFIILTEKNINS